MERVLVSWSGGKDSMMALEALRRSSEYEVAGLVTSFAAETDRVAIHEVSRALICEQARALGFPLFEVFVPMGASNAVYEEAFGKVLQAAGEEGISTIAFGDLFLEDIRAWRDQLVAKFAMRAIYPIWGTETGALVRDFLGLGFKAIATCVELAKLSPSFAGRLVDEAFLAELPPDVDPCGENGEFHSFVFDGPLFPAPIAYSAGERVTRGAFSFCELDSRSR